jgi:uncharacterized protein YbbK (DUF523 family)
MLRIAISACLFGERVRYDGGHRRDDALLDAWRGIVEWVPVCPEAECGMGTPREPVRLVRTGSRIRMLGVDSRNEVTQQMESFARGRIDALVEAGICAYVLKARSPSCGVGSTPLFDAEGNTERTGSGLFAAALVARLPDLPVAEEEGLADPHQREAFLERARAFERARTTTSPPSPPSR